jgi:hypothetical protein
MPKGKSKSIKPNQDFVSSHHIKPTEIKDTPITFSFKYLDFSNRKFHITECGQPYFQCLLERFKHLSGLYEKELHNNNSPSLRSHPIRWRDTTEPKGFMNLKGQLSGRDGWQFQLSANEHGRVHGFLLQSVFYIVWFDPKHNLYN